MIWHFLYYTTIIIILLLKVVGSICILDCVFPCFYPISSALTFRILFPPTEFFGTGFYVAFLMIQPCYLKVFVLTSHIFQDKKYSTFKKYKINRILLLCFSIKNVLNLQNHYHSAIIPHIVPPIFLLFTYLLLLCLVR